MTSPRITLKSSLLSSNSFGPHKQLSDVQDSQVTGSKPGKIRLADVIPSSVAAQVKMFNELASPHQKHAESPLSSKFLSTSLADFKNSASSRIEPKEVKSPKFVTHYRGKSLVNEESNEAFAKIGASPRKNISQTRLVSMEDRRLGSLSPKKLFVQTQQSSTTVASALAYRDELKKDVESSPLMKVSEDALYYDTVRHLDECGKCWAQAQKNHSAPFKLKSKLANCSHYRQEHSYQQRVDQGPVLKNSLYDTIQSKTCVDLESTMKTSFQPYKPNFVKHRGTKSTLGLDNATFAARTSYNTDFFNTGTSKAFIERYPQSKTTLEGLPMDGSTSYKKDFGNFFESKGRVTRWPKKADKSPFVDGVPFLSQTTSGDSFQPFKTASMAPADKNNQDYTSIDSFPNQFQSIYGKDFKGKQQFVCPARTFIENNIPPHANHIRAD